MNWDAVNTIAEVIGAIAVVVTLWYVALQMRQATHQAYADNLQSATNRWLDIQCECMETTESADFFRRALNNYDILTPPEKLRFSALMMKLVASFHAILVLYERNLWDADSFDAVERSLVAMLKSPGAFHWYKEVRFTYPRQLVEHLNRAIEENEDPPLTESFPALRNED